jgi:hypothetical protein
MSKAYGIVHGVCWVLGVLSLAAAIVLRILPSLQDRLEISPRGGMIFAAVLFLCVLASKGACKTTPSS